MVTWTWTNKDDITTKVQGFLCSNSPHYVLQQLDLFRARQHIMKFMPPGQLHTKNSVVIANLIGLLMKFTRSETTVTLSYMARFYIYTFTAIIQVDLC